MTEPYQSTKEAFKENPQMAMDILAAVADVLDAGDCVELRKNKDGTPKMLRVRRENLNTLAG